jgi:acetyl-CoA carboxylase biotin carboxyl carrier protein
LPANRIARETERLMDIDLDKLRELMRALEEHDVSELELEQENERIFLRRGAPPVATAMPATAVSAPAAPAATPATPEEPEDPNAVFVTSPFVGTFYRSPSPSDPPFVDVGQEVKPGQSLCIVEAMKLMNEIEAEFACTILEVLVENGKPVEYGDRLFKVRKTG